MDSIPQPDRSTIERAVRVLFDDEDMFELRVIGPSGIERGYYNDTDKAVNDAMLAAEEPGSQVYAVLNRISSDLTTRVNNTISHGSATKDANISHRRWLLIDLDPCKPAGMSASQSEKQAALDRGREVQKWLSAQGWPAPAVSDSGNGVHLVYALDLENSPEVTTVINGVLRALDGRFSDEVVSIDQSVGNPSRIAKLPGSVARKGTHTEARPHRTARLLHVPDLIEAVSLEQLQSMAPPEAPPPPDPVPGTNGDAFDVPGLLRQHAIGFSHQPGYQSEQGPADLFVLDTCPWAAGHTTGPGGACVMQFQSGATSFSCRHEHCQGRGWEDFKQHLGIGAGPSVDDLTFGPDPSDCSDLKLDLPRPELGAHAYHGPLGEYAQLAGEHTEADPVAVLLQSLACFGVAAGRYSYFTVGGATEHYPKLFVALVGKTSRGRKGLAMDVCTHVMQQADSDFAGLLKSGLSSGEGIVEAVRDPKYGVNKKGEPVLEIPGVEDKRKLFSEPELASVFARMRREGNTLSAVLRDMWDSKRLEVITRKDPLRATGAHLGLVAHVTPDELRKTLQPSDIENGLANRILWAYSERRQLLPRGGGIPDRYVHAMAQEFSSALDFARQVRDVGMSGEAWEIWDHHYRALDEEQGDRILEAMTSRAPAQIRRVALIYALVDRREQVEPEHLRAGIDCFQYCCDTLRHCFTAGVDDEEALQILGRIMARLKTGPASRTDLSDLFQRHVPAAKLRAVLTAAELRGLVFKRTDSTEGRPVDFFSVP